MTVLLIQIVECQTNGTGRAVGSTKCTPDGLVEVTFETDMNRYLLCCSAGTTMRIQLGYQTGQAAILTYAEGPEDLFSRGVAPGLGVRLLERD